MKIQELLCGIRGHELMKNDGKYRCIYCLKTTEFTELYKVPLSAGDREDLYEYLQDCEMSLHGGG